MMHFEAQDWAMLCNGILVFGPDQVPPAPLPVLFSVPTRPARRTRKAPSRPTDTAARTLRAG
jgi:hypothetical protein